MKNLADYHFKLVPYAAYKGFRFSLRRVLYNLAKKIQHFDYDKAKAEMERCKELQRPRKTISFLRFSEIVLGFLDPTVWRRTWRS